MEQKLHNSKELMMIKELERLTEENRILQELHENETMIEIQTTRAIFDDDDWNKSITNRGNYSK
jgi:hypothetical protein